MAKLLQVAAEWIRWMPRALGPRPTQVNRNIGDAVLGGGLAFDASQQHSSSAPISA